MYTCMEVASSQVPLFYHSMHGEEEVGPDLHCLRKHYESHYFGFQVGYPFFP